MGVGWGLGSVGGGPAGGGTWEVEEWTMVGSGVFLLPASLAPFGGISILGWVFTAVGALLVAMMLARFGMLMPATGGPYAYTRRGIGPMAGFLLT